MELPLTYQQQAHPTVPCDKNCKLCPLGKMAENVPIFGAGPDKLEDVKLIIISDHPGYYERKSGFPLYNNDVDRQHKSYGKDATSKILDWRNAGGYMRAFLNENFGLDSYTDTWVTNVVKCDRMKEKTLNESKHIAPCVTQWLIPELNLLDEAVPNAPILIAGTSAYRGFKRVDATLKRTLPNSVHDVRRRTDIRWRNHPVVFTMNPAAVCKLDWRIETSVGLTPTEKYRVLNAQFWHNDLPRSPARVFKDDLLVLKEFLNEAA